LCGQQSEDAAEQQSGECSSSEEEAASLAEGCGGLHWLSLSLSGGWSLPWIRGYFRTTTAH
jgi:hypothetical protein